MNPHVSLELPIDALADVVASAVLDRIERANPTFTIPRHAYNVAETAQALGMSRASVTDLISRGEIPAVKYGGRWLIPAADLTAWLHERASARAELDGRPLRAVSA